MSANEFGREGHFQICRSDAEQPWFARWCKNYREIWRTSENYTRRAGALNAIKTLPGGAEWLESKTPLEVDERRPTSGQYVTVPSGRLHPFDPEACPAAGCIPEAWVNQSDVEPE